MEAKMFVPVKGDYLILTHNKGSVTGIYFPRGLKALKVRDYLEGLPIEEIAQWRELFSRYFQGEPVNFSIPVGLPEMPNFTLQVLNITRTIGWGETLSYGDIARRLNKRGGARAVGQALGKNPIPILIPCHRVISSSGHLGGFTGGVDWKRWLLDLEQVVYKEG